MNFGDILNQWDSQQKEQNKKNTPKEKQVSKKKANADFIEAGYASKAEADKNTVIQKKTVSQQMEEDSKKKINPMELWLRRYGTVDKDKVIEQYQQNQKLQSHDYIKNMPVDAYLDLHGLTRDEAWPRLEAFTSDCIRRGMKKIMFIHGKGNHSSSNDPVLGELVRLFIEKNKMLGTSGHPNRTQGGSGATWVMIKNLKG
ncbi:MAG: Smr/MutS family protein [Treponema sp.]|uniref:Smr/MutS family protein n=1 Tax=Treponema sp. TaxID=166 RepID=UPI00298E5176|nr:Smr/MutS family protein [Treponema sp.]MCQ2601422.1 Smr/MutS family protein [Treponema sp.]